MSREIKFRAWDKDLNKMLRHQVLEFHPKEFFKAINGSSKWKVMQYTGLKDKNGREIYEDDIVRNGTENMVVVWDENDAGYCLEFDSGNQSIGINQRVMKDCEVIGNIWENPELLAPPKHKEELSSE